MFIRDSHTLEDQIETIDMRKARGRGRGLSGMAPATLYDGRVWILRPLLAQRRADLREQLRRRGIAWLEDPTNDDRRYERARLRLSAKAIPAGPGLTSSEAVIETAKRQRLELGTRAAALIQTHARPAGRGLVRLDRAFGSAIDRDAAVYALRILLAATGGVEQLPDLVRATALFDRLKQGNLRSTLSRTVVDARRDAVFLRRENRCLPAAVATPKPGWIWDGRYRIGRLPDGVTIAAPGPAMAAAMLAEQGAAAVAASPASLQRAALAVEPALWRDGICEGLAGVADPVRQHQARRIIAPWARFLPSFDLAPAKAAAALFGADIPPEPPFAGHKAGKG
jgi:tRNA(Ile)-lysidine synthase